MCACMILFAFLLPSSCYLICDLRNHSNYTIALDMGNSDSNR